MMTAAVRHFNAEVACKRYARPDDAAADVLQRELEATDWRVFRDSSKPKTRARLTTITRPAGARLGLEQSL